MSESQAAMTVSPSPPSLLTEGEANFVYNLEVLGLPLRKAADMAGVKPTIATAAHVVQARELLKRELRGSTAVTREDVVFGIQDAIGRAKILADPKAEIMGWKEIGTMLGYYEPRKIDVNLNASVEVLQKNIRTIPTNELVKRLGADSIIDADFYEVEQ